jgi:hypothetical protein
MKALQATVIKGRLVVNEPTDLPEGTVVDVVVADDWDNLDDAERAALHTEIEESLAEAEAGKTRPVEQVIEELRARYGGRSHHPKS